MKLRTILEPTIDHESNDLKRRLLQRDIQKGLDDLAAGRGLPLDIELIIEACKAKHNERKRV